VCYDTRTTRFQLARPAQNICNKLLGDTAVSLEWPVTYSTTEQQQNEKADIRLVGWDLTTLLTQTWLHHAITGLMLYAQNYTQ